VCVGGLQISTGSWRVCVGDDIVLVERRLTDVLCVQQHASLNANYSFTHTHTHTDRLSAAAVLPRDAMLARYIRGEVTSPSPWPRYDRHFVGITRCNVWRSVVKICRVIQINLC